MSQKLGKPTLLLAASLIHLPLFAGSPGGDALITTNRIGPLKAGMSLPQTLAANPNAHLSLIAVGVADYRGLRRGRWEYSVGAHAPILFECACRVDSNGQWVAANLTGTPKEKNETTISFLSTSGHEYKTERGVGVGDTLNKWVASYPDYGPLVVQRGTVRNADSMLVREVACFSPAGSIEFEDKRTGNLIPDPILSKLPIKRGSDQSQSPVYYVLNVSTTKSVLVGSYGPDRNVTAAFEADAVVEKVSVGRECRFDLGAEEFWR